MDPSASQVTAATPEKGLDPEGTLECISNISCAVGRLNFLDKLNFPLDSFPVS